MAEGVLPALLPPGTATGVGSLPGTDIREAVRLVLGELPDLPHLPELPARGPGADLIGRSAGLLVDLHVDLQPAGWRLVDRPGREVRRARSLMDEDLDTLEEFTQGYTGALKLAVAGPWTLAAGIELPRGNRALADPGASHELAESLAAGIADHVAQVRRRIPGAQVLLQLDEPSLPAVLAGAVPSASGWDRLRAVDEPVAEAALRAVLAAVDVPVVVHCCAAQPPLGLLRRLDLAGISVDALLLRLDRPGRHDDELGQLVEAGITVFAGVVPSLGGPLSEPAATVAPVRAAWHRLGFAPQTLASSVVVTPTCGLAGATPAAARAALATARAAGRSLVDDPEG